jgi:hypothetical protein
VCKGARMSQRRSFRSSFLSVASGVRCVLLVGSSGCDKTDPPIPDDGNDLAVKPADLSHGHTGDMAMNGAAWRHAVATSAMGGCRHDQHGSESSRVVPSCTDTGVTGDISL